LPGKPTYADVCVKNAISNVVIAVANPVAAEVTPQMAEGPHWFTFEAATAGPPVNTFVVPGLLHDCAFATMEVTTSDAPVAQMLIAVSARLRQVRDTDRTQGQSAEP
jgi:hypothetical protein